MTLEESKKDNDIIDQGYGVSLITDKNLSVHLEGATIDYIKSGNQEGFEIRTAQPPGGGCADSCGGCC